MSGVERSRVTHAAQGAGRSALPPLAHRCYSLRSTLTLRFLRCGDATRGGVAKPRSPHSVGRGEGVTRGPVSEVSGAGLLPTLAGRVGRVTSPPAAVRPHHVGVGRASSPSPNPPPRYGYAPSMVGDGGKGASPPEAGRHSRFLAPSRTVTPHGSLR